MVVMASMAATNWHITTRAPRLCEDSVRVKRLLAGEDAQLRQNVEVDSVDDLLNLCPVPDLSKRDLLLQLGPGSPAFSQLFNAVGQMMQDEAAGLGAWLPAFPSHPCVPDVVQQWLSQSRTTLLAARPKGRGKPAWLPACKALEGFAEAAGGFTDDTSLLDFLGSEDQGGLVLMLLAALATGRLYERLEMDGQPVMQFIDGGLQLEMLEIKTQSSGIKQAVRQLQAQADILLLALALCNPGLLQHGPLHVVGIVAMAADTVTKARIRHYEHLQLTVGGKGPAPKAAMRLRIQC